MKPRVLYEVDPHNRLVVKRIGKSLGLKQGSKDSARLFMGDLRQIARINFTTKFINPLEPASRKK